MEQADRLSDDECKALFMALFPAGPAGEDILDELAPDGWEQAELFAVAHPSPQTLFDEAVQLHENLSNFPLNRKGGPALPPPTMAEVMESYKPSPVDVAAECADLVGRCLWDVFSDNHEVIAPDGRIADIGSFRGAGGFIADWLNQVSGKANYDYMNFYMGTIWVSRRADLSPVYRMIFRRLKNLGFNWRYSFPRLDVVRFGPRPDDQADAPYDPSAGFEKEQAEAKQQQEFENMRESLREAYNESVQESRKQPPPKVVQSYQSVFGRKPDGWPPVEDMGIE